MATPAFPTTIDVTGTSDCSDTLTGWLNEDPTANYVFPSGARLRCDKTIIINTPKGMTIYGNGSTIGTSSVTGPYTNRLDIRARAHVRLVHGTGVWINGLNISGAAPNPGNYNALYEAQHGFDVQSSTGCTISSCSASAVYGDFVYFGSNSGGTDIQSAGHVTGCIFNGAGRQGISVCHGAEVTVDHCHIGGQARSTFDFEPLPGERVSGVYITDNTIGVGRLNFIAAATQNGPVDNVKVERNVSTLKPFNMNVQGWGAGATRANWDINNNVSSATWGTAGPAGCDIIHGADNLTYAGNTQAIQPNRQCSGLDLAYINGGTILWNTFPGAVSAAIVSGTNTNLSVDTNWLDSARTVVSK